MERSSNIVQVHIKRDIDVTNVDATRDMLNRLIEGGCRQIALNMSGVAFVDSAGMAMILAEVRLMKSLHGAITLTDVGDQLFSLFRRMQLEDLVPISRIKRKTKEALSDPTIAPLWRTVVPILKDDLEGTRAAISRLFEQSPLSPSDLFDAMLATGEALGNAVDHARADGAIATVSGYADRVIVEVSDNGPGFDLESLGGISGPADERGRGIRLMNLVADSVTITPNPDGRGTVVRIVKLATGNEG